MKGGGAETQELAWQAESLSVQLVPLSGRMERLLHWATKSSAPGGLPWQYPFGGVPFLACSGRRVGWFFAFDSFLEISL